MFLIINLIFKKNITSIYFYFLSQMNKLDLSDKTKSRISILENTLIKLSENINDKL